MRPYSKTYDEKCLSHECPQTLEFPIKIQRTKSSVCEVLQHGISFIRTFIMKRIPSTGLIIPNLPNILSVLKSLNQRQKKMKGETCLFLSVPSLCDEHTKTLGRESVNRKPFYAEKFYCNMLRLVYKKSSSEWQDPKATTRNTLYNFTQCILNHTHHLLPSLCYDRHIATSKAYDPVLPLSMSSSCLHRLSRLPATPILPSIFLSITCFRTQFLRKDVSLPYFYCS
jgi:hypothetical protein